MKAKGVGLKREMDGKGIDFFHSALKGRLRGFD